MRFLVLLLAFLPFLQTAPAGLPVCSEAVHATYRTTGPDGQQYPTWHPPIDLTAGCAFDHEHGSNPALFDAALKPAFGYTASRHGMVEPHAGFKVYVFRDPGGRDWMILHHQGTTGAARACVAHHTLDVTVKQGGAVVADIHLMANFGRAVENTTDAAVCATAPDGTTGIRKLPVLPTAFGYEPWRVGSPIGKPLTAGNVLGFAPANLTFNTLNPQTSCVDLACATVAPNTDASTGGPSRGTLRILTVNTGLGFTSGANVGAFCTDAMAQTVVDCAAPGATAQYVQPGLSFSLPALPNCRPHDPLTYVYHCTNTGSSEVPYRRNSFVTGPN